VDFHIKNARRKLGATTREAAIARYVHRSRRQTGG
jgi:DNA-binding CsgD family transcriptional regulator